MSFKHARALGLGVGLAGLAPLAAAVTSTWLLTGGGAWDAAENWSHGVPGAGDTAVITPASRTSGTVSLTRATTVGALQLSHLPIQVGASASLLVTGRFDWAESGPGGLGFTFSGGATASVQGAAAITGNAAKGLNANGLLDLAGSTDWSGNVAAGGNAWTVGVNPAGSRATLRNSGVFTDGNGFDTSISGFGVFDNAGNFTKSRATLTTVDIADFRNAGTVNVAAGTMRFTRLTGTQAGNWVVGDGALIDITGGTPTFTGGMAGSGLVRLGGGTVTMEGFGRAAPVLLDGATLAGGYQVFDGPFTWRSGSLTPGGTTVFTGDVRFETDTQKLVPAGRSVQNYGRLSWSGGNISLGVGLDTPGDFANFGEFHDTDATPSAFGGSDRSRFVNAGRYVKTGAGITTFSGVIFENPGTLEIRQGVIRFNTAFTSAGVIDTWQNAGMILAQTLTNNGTLRGDGAVSGPIDNRGLLSPGRGFGRFTADRLTLAPEGVLQIELGAEAADRLVTTGAIGFGGTLSLWNLGWAPDVGDIVTIVSFASRSGSTGFDAVDLHGFASGFGYELVYGANDLRLLVTAVPEPGTAALWLAGLLVAGGVARRRRQAAGAGSKP